MCFLVLCARQIGKLKSRDNHLKLNCNVSFCLLPEVANASQSKFCFCSGTVAIKLLPRDTYKSYKSGESVPNTRV